MRYTAKFKNKDSNYSIKFSQGFWDRISKSVKFDLNIYNNAKKIKGFKKKRDDNLVYWEEGSLDTRTGEIYEDLEEEVKKVIREKWLEEKWRFE